MIETILLYQHEFDIDRIKLGTCNRGCELQLHMILQLHLGIPQHIARALADHRSGMVNVVSMYI